MKMVGIISVSPMTNTGEAGSQAEYPLASNVERMPPFGKEDASGSCWMSCFPENSSTMPPLPSCSTKASCFSAVPSVSGWNQCVQWVTPSSMAHFFMPAATASAVCRSSDAPLSITSHIFLYTSAGRYLYIFCRVNTYFPKNSEGLSVGAGMPLAFFLKASPTTSNLNEDDIFPFSVYGYT